MTRTFAHLGVKPVIDLHAAGLKLAELVLRIPVALRTAEAVGATLGTRGSLLSIPSDDGIPLVSAAGG